MKLPAILIAAIVAVALNLHAQNPPASTGTAPVTTEDGSAATVS